MFTKTLTNVNNWTVAEHSYRNFSRVSRIKYTKIKTQIDYMPPEFTDFKTAARACSGRSMYKVRRITPVRS